MNQKKVKEIPDAQRIIASSVFSFYRLGNPLRRRGVEV